MWDYDKLFAEGNIVGFKHSDEDQICPYIIYEKNDCMDYFNDSLCYKSKDFISEIQYIIRLDEHGNVVEKLFDREEDMPKPMPELETGMFVLIFNYNHTETQLGYINAERNMIIYQSGGWDYVDENKDEILKIYSDSCNCFDGCSEQRAIWRNPEYQSYLDSKSN